MPLPLLQTLYYPLRRQVSLMNYTSGPRMNSRDVAKLIFELETAIPKTGTSNKRGPQQSRGPIR